MTYRATIRTDRSVCTRTFLTLGEAERWLDSENNNLENTTIIETFDENGRKTDSFYYTEKK